MRHVVEELLALLGQLQGEVALVLHNVAQFQLDELEIIHQN